jgi:hypothetical protein
VWVAVEAARVVHRKCLEAEEMMHGRFWATLGISISFSGNYNAERAYHCVTLGSPSLGLPEQHGYLQTEPQADELGRPRATCNVN